MPYVNKDQRAWWDDEFSDISVRGASVGEINYIITKLLLSWLKPEPRYTNYNAAIGVLECIKLELYRRAVVPYEEKKCSEHGDVY